MANTINENQTLNEFRGSYNTLVNEVGSLTGLRGSLKSPNTIVDAINVIEDKTFFFQQFEYVATAGQVTFSGPDQNGNVLKYRQGKIQVYLNGNHLIEGGSGTAGFSAISSGDVFNSGLLINAATSANDVITIYSYTGSESGVAADGGGGGGKFTETASNTIYNTNSAGVILNGTLTAATSLQSGYQIQNEGNTFINGDVKIDTGHTFESPSITDGTATITGGVGTGFSSITSSALVGNLTGNVTGDITGDVKHGGSVVLDASTGALTGTVSSITNHQITDLSDVDTTSPTDGQILVYNSSSSKYVPTNQQTSDTVTEGGTNLYFTGERVLDYLSGTTTGGEGLIGGTGISLSYNDANNTLTINGSAQYGDSDVQSYLSGGAGLALSGSGSFSVNTSNGVKIDGDDVELDYEVVSSAPTGVGSTSVGHLWFVT
tara:strand:- start:46863 stop:48161 length:1299 start_codon:yes stop_codon:yes gene_type:complete